MTLSEIFSALSEPYAAGLFASENRSLFANSTGCNVSYYRTMDVDFGPIMKALKEAGYQGDLTLEVDSEFAPQVTEEEALAKLTHLANVAKKLVQMFEEA